MGYHDHALAKAISDLGIQDKTGMQEIWLTIDLELCAGNFGSDMSETSQAIAQAARKRGLQTIHVEYAQTMPTQDVEAIPHHGRGLRIFRSYYFPILTVTDPLLLLPRNCHWLRCLHIQIEGIPRPDITIEYQGQPIPAGTPLHSGTMEESRSVQRKVYSLLAGLRCLEALRLGQDSGPYRLEQGQLSSGKQVYYDEGWQSTCLEMTLESGMGVLSQLKRMQHLQVQNMEHRIGVRELWWWRGIGLTCIVYLR